MKTYHDIVGDGGSRIVEQVEARRERFERSLGGVRRIVAVGSGKGGVGKSTLTLQLARALRRAEATIAVLDADFNGPSQARLAGLRDTPFVPGENGTALPRTPDGIGVVSLGAVVPESESVEFAGASTEATHAWRATRELTTLNDLVTSVEWGQLDWLLVDLPPGAERTFQFAGFLGERAAVVLVTLPGDVSRGVVARSVHALRNMGNPLLGYVENMNGYYCSSCKDVRPLFPAGRVDLGIPCLGSVPFDPAVAARCDAGAAVDEAQNGPVERAVEETARAIHRAYEEVS